MGYNCAKFQVDTTFLSGFRYGGALCAPSWESESHQNRGAIIRVKTCLKNFENKFAYFEIFFVKLVRYTMHLDKIIIRKKSS